MRTLESLLHRQVDTLIPACANQYDCEIAINFVLCATEKTLPTLSRLDFCRHKVAWCILIQDTKTEENIPSDLSATKGAFSIKIQLLFIGIFRHFSVKNYENCSLKNTCNCRLLP